MTTATLCMNAARREFNGGSTTFVYEDEAIADAFAKVYNAEPLIAQYKVSFKGNKPVMVVGPDGAVDDARSDALTEKMFLALCGAVAIS